MVNTRDLDNSAACNEKVRDNVELRRTVNGVEEEKGHKEWLEGMTREINVADTGGVPAFWDWLIAEYEEDFLKYYGKTGWTKKRHQSRKAVAEFVEAFT